jgi:drug/metabolite transporter (DMT)-like permease
MSAKKPGHWERVGLGLFASVWVILSLTFVAEGFADNLPRIVWLWALGAMIVCAFSVSVIAWLKSERLVGGLCFVLTAVLGSVFWIVLHL